MLQIIFMNSVKNSNYIRKDRIQKDKKWTVDSPYGVIDITINLSKPEKDPKAIAAAKKRKTECVIQSAQLLHRE